MPWSSRSFARPILAVAASLALAAIGQAAQGPGVVWSFGSGIEGWIPKSVSIGNRGTQVFSRVGTGSNYTRLFSAHDSTSPSPVWTYTGGGSTTKPAVDSAEDVDIHVSIHERYLSGSSGPRRPVVQKFTSSSAFPDWSYEIATDHSGGELSAVAISDSGQTIAAVSYENAPEYDPRVLVFNSASSTPLVNVSIPMTGSPSGMRLSGDGSTVYIWGFTKQLIIDAASGQLLWTGTLSTDPIWPGHALSYDGKRFALGAANTLRIYERTGQAYSEVHRHFFPAGYRCEAIDISRDGSTLVCGANSSADNLSVQFMTMDLLLPGFPVRMQADQTGGGTKTNLVSAVAVDATGQTFAAGLWGDEQGMVPEAQFFETDDPEPIWTRNLSGSVLALDLSEDGRHAAFGVKSAHANDFTNGGDIMLFEARPVDFRMVGVPRTGAQVTFKLHAPGEQPGNGIVIRSEQLAPVPDIFPEAGTLYLLRSQLTFFSMGTIGPDGDASRTLPVPSSAQPGTSYFFQGLRTNPRTLSRDFVQMTVVP